MTDPDVHPGYLGMFTRDQCAIAKYRNGARIVKVRNEPNSTMPVGAQGTVLGSMGHPKVGVGYFVEWDCKPRVAVFLQEWKIGLAPRSTSVARSSCR